LLLFGRSLRIMAPFFVLRIALVKLLTRLAKSRSPRWPADRVYGSSEVTFVMPLSVLLPKVRPVCLSGGVVPLAAQSPNNQFQERASHSSESVTGNKDFR